jgi:threonine dehydratase
MSSPVAHGVTIADVRGARERIAGIAHITPVLTSNTFDLLASNAAAASSTTPAETSLTAGPAVSLFFKCELFQKIGAFKFRGAVNAIKLALASSSSPEKLVVVTHSSGNHAQALALAGRMLGVRAIIVMPRNAPQVKVNAVRGYGGEIVQCENTQASRESTADAQVALHAPYGVLIPPYDSHDIMAGQGTLALEFLEQVADLDALVVPVGGGGMLSGVCIAAKAINPAIRIYAAEPAEADDAFQSLTKGERIPLPAPTSTVADGLRTSLGLLTYPILRDHVSGVILASEEEIVTTMKLVMERMKIVIEPSAAVGVAAVLSKQFWTTGEAAKSAGALCRDNNPHVIGMDDGVKDKPIRRVGVVLCGGNVDLDALPWVGKK